MHPIHMVNLHGLDECMALKDIVKAFNSGHVRNALDRNALIDDDLINNNITCILRKPLRV